MDPIKREVIIGDCRLLLGDCLEILPTLPKVDAVITDPPYGVNLEYGDYDDSFDNWKNLIDSFLPLALAICNGSIIVPTSKFEGEQYIHRHNPIWRLCWFKGASCTRSPIGFKDWEPTFIFGRAPKKQCHDYFTAHANSVRAEISGHPCPKPYAWAKWLVDKMSERAETILDPFMGSGTTGVACVKLGRKFVGIEIEERYFDIACRRIRDAYAQYEMFKPEEIAPKAEQISLDNDDKAG